MSKQNRVTTKYPGVFFIQGTSLVDGRPERIFYIRYYRDGRRIEEKAGRERTDGMTAAKANRIRGLRIAGKDLPNEKRREEARAEREKPTFRKLWQTFEQHADVKHIRSARSRFRKYLEADFGDKTPEEVRPLDLDRLRIGLAKRGKSPATVRHVLGLLVRLANFGEARGLCGPIPFKVKMPRVSNEHVESLDPETLARFLKVLEKHPNRNLADALRLTLYTGLRRGEVLGLRWWDVDFTTGTVTLIHTKSGKVKRLPLNRKALEVIRARPRGGEYLFRFARGGEGRLELLRSDKRDLKAIREAAGLPEGFRPFHGLRHTAATLLVSHGASLYVVGRLLTHASSGVTKRYAHLGDRPLREAGELLADLIDEAAAAAPARAAGKGA